MALQAAYAEFVKTFFFGTFGVSPQSYDQEYLKLTKSGPDSGEYKNHQFCSRGCISWKKAISCFYGLQVAVVDLLRLFHFIQVPLLRSRMYSSWFLYIYSLEYLFFCAMTLTFVIVFRWSSMVVSSVHGSCILSSCTFTEQHSLPWRRWEVRNVLNTYLS